MTHQLIADAKRIVIKVGSGVLTNADGVDFDRIDTIAGSIAGLMDDGRQVILVSSGAVAAGRVSLGVQGPLSINVKQAAAAIGQPRLMRQYKESFLKREKIAAQVLLTRDDLSHRRRYLNARNTIRTLLDFGAVPIINENDTVVVEEIRLGDNDNLSALVTSPAEADLLIILSDVDGLYDDNPAKNPDAQLIPEVREIDAAIETLAGGSSSGVGTGGMATKIEAAKTATRNGIPTVIINGLKPERLDALFAGDLTGTFFHPVGNRLNARKHWIAYASTPVGMMKVDAGAERALKRGGKSLLSSGITQVEGEFDRGETVCIQTEEGCEFARGIVSYDAKELQQIAGAQSSEIESILGYKYCDEIIHRDSLVIL